MHPLRWANGGRLFGDDPDSRPPRCPLCDRAFDDELDCMCPTCRQNTIAREQAEARAAENDD